MGDGGPGLRPASHTESRVDPDRAAPDRTLLHVFALRRRCARRARQRRFLQAATAVSALLLAAAFALGWRCGETGLVALLGAWSALFLLTHCAVLSEWVLHARALALVPPRRAPGR